jgi:outer membrane protein, heavy metal efflux system
LYWTAALVLATGVSAFAQEMNGTPTPLAPLIAEAEANNTQISAADHSWKAATHVAQQVTTLPDPQFTVQALPGPSSTAFYDQLVTAPSH